MSKCNLLTVILETPRDSDDLVNAIKQLRGVLDVIPKEIPNDYYSTKIQAKNELIQELKSVLYPFY